MWIANTIYYAKNLMCYDSTSLAHAVSLEETGNCLFSFIYSSFYTHNANILMPHYISFLLLFSLLNSLPHYTFSMLLSACLSVSACKYIYVYMK